MKPVKLVINAFGSYGKREEIDFTKTAQNLFLITGDTGAGKSTIFDAIVFALYGEASSENNKKDGAELQSQFADVGVEPYVELTFEERDELYTVRRVPRHLVKKRNGGEKTESEKVSLALPGGIEQSTKETDGKLIELVGLTKQQFMQVAMIAQGEFMNLLRAKTNDKKEIFRKLFDTNLYQNIIDELYKRLKAKNKEIAEIRTICQTELGHLELPEDYELSEAIINLKNNILKSDTLSITAMEELMEKLAAACIDLDKECKVTEDKFNEVAEEFKNKNDEYSKAEQLIKRFDEYDNAIKDLDECKKQEFEMENNKKLIKLIADSYEINDIFKRFEDEENRLIRIKKELNDCEKRLFLINSEYEKNEKAEAECKNKLDKITEESTKIIEKARNDIDKLTAIAGKIKCITDVDEKIGKAIQNKNNIEGKLEKNENNEKLWQETVEKYEGEELRLNKIESNIKEVEAVLTDISDINEKYSDINALKKKSGIQQNKYIELKTIYESINIEYEKKRSIFLDNQAGMLAETLEEGEPCPVCGSVSHPMIHIVGNGAETVTKDNLDEIKAKVSEADDKQQKASDSIKNINVQISEREKALNTDIEKMKSCAENIITISVNSTVTDIENKLNEYMEELSEKHSICENNVNTLKNAQENIRKVKETKEELKNELKASEEDISKLNIDRTSYDSAINALKQDLKYENEEKALASIKEAEIFKNEKEFEYEQIKNKFEKSKSDKKTTETLIDNYKNDIPLIEAQCDMRKNEYTISLSDKNISEEAWKKCVEEYARDTKAISDKLDVYNKRYAAANAIAESTKADVEGKQRPDMTQLSEMKNKVESIYTELQKKKNQTEIYARSCKEIFQRLNRKIEERAETSKEAARLSSLYNRLAGKESGARMDIETFVQRYYLERILEAANIRFLDMTVGQFELRMYDIDKAGEGKNRGLDLMVYSNVTGKEREVRTLSGGESFIAALALALGMADMIQESSAVVKLDMMFIDEGFGSLDDHSRDQAVKVLKNMATGSKLIGIISHVTELKQEIEDQIIVTKGDNGSSVRWQIS